MSQGVFAISVAARKASMEIANLRVVTEIFASAIRRRQAEHALRESEQRFRAIAEHATELVSEFDNEGRYHYASPSFARHLDYDPAELVGKHASATRVYIGRPSKWGNPFVIGRDGSRAEVVAKYRAWIVTQPALMNALEELRGRDLVCWCAPLACHGDVLIDLANRR